MFGPNGIPVGNQHCQINGILEFPDIVLKVFFGEQPVFSAPGKFFGVAPLPVGKKLAGQGQDILAPITQRRNLNMAFEQTVNSGL